MQAKPHSMDYPLFFAVLILVAAGVLTVFSASAATALHDGLPASYYAVRQLVASVIGVGVLAAVVRVPYRFWYRRAPVLVLIGYGLLLLVFVPHIGMNEGGGWRWIGRGSLHLQPSELAIIFNLIYLSFFFTKKAMFAGDFKKGYLPAMIVTGMTCALILVEPDMGTSMTLAFSAIVILFASGVALKPLFAVIGTLGAAGVLLAFVESYRSARVEGWLHPFQYADSLGLQLVQGLTALSAGGWFGRGFDMSMEKLGYLPAPYTDFVFPVFVEEWGLVGAIAMLCTFCFLIWRGFVIARYARDRFGALLAVGITGMIAIKTFINLGAVTGLLPVTGIPLPFISYGGTSLVMNLFAVGLLLSVSRYTLETEPEFDPMAEVIPVDAASSRRPGVPDGGAMDHNLSDRPVRRPAEVRPLRPSGRTTPPSSSGAPAWRSRRETAAAKTAPRQSARAPVPPERTWAARRGQNSSGPKGGKPPGKGSGKRRWRGFRKER
ncbi:putative peptidoglycan glycosyltransferase FtsW [Alicyclobacillus sp.]|uniref:FtsW/RodA/SpoVE family cell cycle protein n=1 Tax=Alicyclobacillus sp. TaxID=61169 RepID=UPI0025C69B27|nr:putative peptidoglycan glycosyltransferase FtsW [Alicyclobacillus sp.]MCL6515444.1 FtsW/RodA/SpoVE family cell cycle protein [Alicyclobacillus sp.]